MHEIVLVDRIKTEHLPALAALGMIEGKEWHIALGFPLLARIFEVNVESWLEHPELVPGKMGVDHCGSIHLWLGPVQIVIDRSSMCDCSSCRAKTGTRSRTAA